MKYSNEEREKYMDVISLITDGLSRKEILKRTQIDVLTVPELKYIYEQVQASRR